MSAIVRDLIVEIITVNKLNVLKSEIISYLGTTDGATASDVYNYIKTKFKKKSRSEVYKRLSDLKSLGLITKTQFKDKSDLNRPASIWYLTGNTKAVKKVPEANQLKDERNYWQSEAERLGELLEVLNRQRTEEIAYLNRNLKFQADQLVFVSNYLNSKWYLGERGLRALNELNEVINQLTNTVNED